MPKSYSGDLRERVIDAVESGASRHEAAERFEVSVSSSVRWLQAWRKDRRARPKPRGGSVSPLEDHAAQILGLHAEKPDRSLLESVGELSKRRIKTSKSALSRFFLRHGITYKKSLQAAERERADVARARRRWIREQGMLEPARLVFIDETSINTSMTRLRGRSLRGEPLIDRVPMAHWTTITFVAALRHDKMVAPMVIDPRYFRPTEVELLVGDPSKARKKLGWQHKVSFDALVAEMVDADFELLTRESGQRVTTPEPRRRAVGRA
jgi:transposase